MSAGLFYVYTEPGTVDEAEFHDWYDNEHGPARLTVPGFRGVLRYRALDEQKPTWLALYELDGPEVIDSPGYTALAGQASDRDKAVMAALGALERRVYEQISEDGSPMGRPAPVILAVSLSVPAESEADLAAWYTEEHIPMLLQVPGWRRIRRYRLVRGLDGPGPEPSSFLSLHELAGPEVLEEPGYRAAISTPWRDRVVASALRRERREFGLRNVIGG
ncbi:MAG TPA: hypothetical protein VFQ68_31080 [Streptosporangiaceae bacterium]|nr:hypothetical protein [Streptosporangiaceae bacterium]